MLRCALFFAACVAAAVAPARAEPLTLICHVTNRPSGEQFDRTVTIDAEARSVLDNYMQYNDGDPSVFGPDVEKYVRPGEGVIAWGYHRKSTGANAIDAMLDLKSWTYTLRVEDAPGESRGPCRRTAASVS